VTPQIHTMTREERKAALALASIYALRMFGLFSLLPVFAIAGRELKGGEASYMVALALSIYGLTQALFFIPYGAASDRFGRKPVILFGLIVFAAGSVVAALSDSVAGVALGRALQGAGAVSSAVTALLADCTRDTVRTKAMAMVGGSIALTFALALIVAPPLVGAIGLSGLFWITAALALISMLVLYAVVPTAPAQPEPAETLHHGDVLFHPQLFRLNFGVFVLHAAQMALFVIVPPLLVSSANVPTAQHWKIYLPVLIISVLLMWKPMMAAERHGRTSAVFRLAIGLLMLTFLTGPIATSFGLAGLVVFLIAFFWGFNTLEALQPSLVSRVAPPSMKGFAMGVYNTTQAMGLFLGGILGGVVTKRMGDNSVFYWCAGLFALWLAVAWHMKVPHKVSKESEQK
jgi:predicted MFS family arabinose efflux permease